MTINFDTALQSHAQWKVKLRKVIEQRETLDAEAIARDNRCEIGRWLHGEAKTRYARRPDYEDCLAAHARFHRAAGQVAKVINQKAYDLALDMLKTGTEYSNASAGVALSIYEFRKHVESDPDYDASEMGECNCDHH